MPLCWLPSGMQSCQPEGAQGHHDILPLIQYLNYSARPRCPGIQQRLIDIKNRALQQLPHHAFAYLPRERNALADHLADLGTNSEPPQEGGEIYSNPPLPDRLCHKINLYMRHSTSKISTSLRHHVWLCRYLPLIGTHTQCTQGTLPPHDRAYHMQWATTGSSIGGHHAQGTAAQRLPRALRALLFGRTHTEIDIIGATCPPSKAHSCERYKPKPKC